jgi:hypothetical protein
LFGNLNRAEDFINDSNKDDALDIAKIICTPNAKAGIVRAYLKQLVEYEKLSDKGRDHVIHTIHTYLLGMHIITLLDNINIDRFTWKIASLFHDIGYPHSKYFPKTSSLNTLYTDHGFCSAQITWNNLFLKYLVNNPAQSETIKPKGRYRVDYTWSNLEKYILPACEAILLHNEPQNYLRHFSKKVYYQDNKHAFLLILCDTVQNWSRPSNSSSHPSVKLNPKDYFMEIQSTEPDIYKMSLKFPVTDDAEKVKDELLKKCYFENIDNHKNKLTICWKK